MIPTRCGGIAASAGLPSGNVASVPNDYDRVAAEYDEHFTRRADRWEDERLIRLLRPHVDGRSILDLGCGTGWVADHLEPGWYVGVDSSAPMLDRLAEKHPDAVAVKAEVGAVGWWTELPAVPFDTVTATWSAHELVYDPGALRHLLVDIRGRTLATHVILHGQGPRYADRDHYVLADDDSRRAYLRWRPDLIDRETPHGWRLIGFTGTGVLADRYTDRGPEPLIRALWRLSATLVAPRHHYGLAAHWRRT